MKTRLRRDNPSTFGKSLSSDRPSRLRRLLSGGAIVGGLAVAAGALSLGWGKGSNVHFPGVQTAYAGARNVPVHCAKRPEQLQKELSAIAAGFNGKVGIAVTQAGCDWVVGERTDQYFPQQSVSKLWVALSVLDAVDRGKASLDEQLTLRPEDLVVFNQPLRWKVLEEGSVTLPVRTMMQDALSLSDNLANDKLLWRIGGPDHVRAVLAERKIEGIRFGPGERLLQSHIAGLQWTPELAVGSNFAQARTKLPMARREALLASYIADPLDGATPAGVARTLGRLGLGELLSADSTALLLNIMAHSHSGPMRLKAGVSRGWEVFHKTGTGQELNGLASGYNDVALFRAPDGTLYGVAVMIGETRLPIRARMEMMQAVSRAVVASHARLVDE